MTASARPPVAVDYGAESAGDPVRDSQPTTRVIHTLANQVMELNQQIAEMDKLIAARFREHEHAEILASLPGLHPIPADDPPELTGLGMRW